MVVSEAWGSEVLQRDVALRCFHSKRRAAITRVWKLL